MWLYIPILTEKVKRPGRVASVSPGWYTIAGKYCERWQMRYLRFAPALLGLLPGALAGQSLPVPFQENFDAAAPPALPDGWLSSQCRTAGINDFTTTSSSPRSAPNAVLSTNATIAQELQTPPLDFRLAEPESLCFHIRRSSSHAARVVVEASTDQGATFPVLVGDTLRGSATTSYVPVRWPLPGLLGGGAGVRLRWRIIADPGGSSGTFRLDDVSITGRPLHDLAIAVRLQPESPCEGDTVRVLVDVANRGRAAAGAYTATVFLDADGDSTGDPFEVIGTAAGSAGLPAGDSVLLAVEAGAPPPGRRIMIARLSYPGDQDTLNNVVVFLLSVGYREGAVVVNEIMYAPEGDEPEWVELLNRREEPVDLNGWMVSDNTVNGKRPIATSPRFIAGHGMTVMTRDSAALRRHYPLMPPVILAVPGFPALNNTGDAVVVYDDRLAVVDSVWYAPSWGGDAGRSLERIDPDAGANDRANWSAPADSFRATPGAQNSVVILDDDLRVARLSDQVCAPGAAAPVTVVVQNIGRRALTAFSIRLFWDADGDSLAEPDELVAASGDLSPPARRESVSVIVPWQTPPPGSHALFAQLDYPPDQRLSNNLARATLRVSYPPGAVVVNEVMAQPVGDRAEYVEILNRTDRDLPLDGWYLRGPSASAHFPLAVGAERLAQGHFLVIASDSSLYLSFPSLRAAEGNVVRIAGSPLGLNNDGDDIVIADPTGAAIDSVSYTSSWHNPGVDNPAGRSLERIRPHLGSNDPRNWSTAVHPAGGTPCAANSIFTAVLPPASSIAVSPNPFSPDGDGRDDFAVVQFTLPFQVSVVRLRIYDVRGRLIRTLANNEPAGPRGEVIWDGLDDDRRKARMGIYVLLLEAIDDRGGVVETTKATVVLAGRL